MKLYRVKDWAERYENNRSKTVKDLSWVPIPNRHDGWGYACIMAHERAAEIFSAFILILQLASRCHPRGSLVRDDGTPLTPGTMAIKTRAKKEWFEAALEFLSAPEIEWLTAEDVDTSGAAQSSQVPDPCQCGAQSADRLLTKNGKKGMEKNGSEGSAHAPHVPSVEEVIARGDMIGVPPDFCRHYHAICSEKHRWLVQSPTGEKLIGWQSELKRWWEKDRHKWKPPTNPQSDISERL